MMRNYIVAELYRNFKRPGYWIFNFLGCAVVVLVYALIVYGNSISEYSHITFDIMLMMLLSVLPGALYFMPVFAEMVTSEENKNLTLRNVLTFGLPREKMFISKLIVSTVLGIVSLIIVLLFYAAVGLVCVKPGPDLSVGYVMNFLATVAVSIPIWIGAVSICSLFALIFRNGSAFSVTYILFLIFSPKIAELLVAYVSDKFMFIYNNLLIGRATEVISVGGQGMGFEPAFVLTIIAVGAAYTLISAGLGILYLRRAEIK